ncbi:unnamed protein product [Sphagnum troendelagicum]|uniref:Uncharacterized protein n=1 Tax=Sphagnum troendelagicum TaxID=128251 RepID=A0ABP0U6L1_9BRYO
MMTAMRSLQATILRPPNNNNNSVVGLDGGRENENLGMELMGVAIPGSARQELQVARMLHCPSTLNKQRMMMLASSSSSTLGCKKKQRGDAFFTEPAVARCTSFGGRGLVPSRSSCTHYVCCADNQRAGSSFVSSDLDNGAEEEGIWERVQLLERQLGVAVSEENYAEASRLRDQILGLKGRLTPAEQFLLTNSGRLTNGSLGQRMTAIAALGDLGDHRTLPILLNGLRDENPHIVDQTEKAMWKIFMRSGMEEVDQRLQEGVAQLISRDGYRQAESVFTEIIKMAPSFAEGYNKRATVHYLLQEYEEAIQDCRSTLALNPYHFGALSGLGLCYAALQDLESALFWFEKAFTLHPGLLLIGKYIEALKQKLDQRNGSSETRDRDSQ